MAYTDTDLQAIESAIATGERRVSFSDGRSIEYRTVDELIRARGLIRSEIEAAATLADTGRRRSRFTRLYQGGDGR